jgi:hypothetical protein
MGARSATSNPVPPLLIYSGPRGHAPFWRVSSGIYHSARKRGRDIAIRTFGAWRVEWIHAPAIAGYAIQACLALDKADQSKMTDDEKVGFKIVKRAGGAHPPDRRTKSSGARLAERSVSPSRPPWAAWARWTAKPS